MGENFQTGHDLGRWNQSAGVQLGHHTVQSQLLLQLLEALYQAFAGAEGDFSSQDFIVAEGGQPLGSAISKLGSVDPGPAR